MENNIDKTAVLIAESVATMERITGIASFSDTSIKGFHSAEYSKKYLSQMENKILKSKQKLIKY